MRGAEVEQRSGLCWALQQLAGLASAPSPDMPAQARLSWVFAVALPSHSHMRCEAGRCDHPYFLEILCWDLPSLPDAICMQLSACKSLSC